MTDFGWYISSTDVSQTIDIQRFLVLRNPQPCVFRNGQHTIAQDRRIQNEIVRQHREGCQAAFKCDGGRSGSQVQRGSHANTRLKRAGNHTAHSSLRRLLDHSLPGARPARLLKLDDQDISRLALQDMPRACQVAYRLISRYGNGYLLAKPAHPCQVISLQRLLDVLNGVGDAAREDGLSLLKAPGFVGVETQAHRWSNSLAHGCHALNLLLNALSQANLELHTAKALPSGLSRRLASHACRACPDHRVDGYGRARVHMGRREQFAHPAYPVLSQRVEQRDFQPAQGGGRRGQLCSLTFRYACF